MKPPTPASHLPPSIGLVLRRTPKHRWNSFAVLVDEEAGDAKLMLRGELAAWLRANDLRDIADEASARRVPPGGLLILFLGHRGPRFQIVGGDVRAPGVPRGSASPRKERRS